MRAASTMTRDVTVIPPELDLASAWRIMKREHIRHLPVLRAGALVGMLSDRDVLLRSEVDEDGHVEVPEATLVAEAMTAMPLETCESSTSVADLARLMTEKKIDAIPVVHGLRLVGLVTSNDLLALLVRREEARPLPFEFRIVESEQAYA